MRVVILHGYSATPSNHWFASLAEQARAWGAAASIPALPDTANPRRSGWVAAARRAFALSDQGATPGEGLVVVAHSLGCPTALLALPQQRPPHLRGLVLVSGFYEQVAEVGELNDFLADLPELPAWLSEIPLALIASDDDTVVPPALTQRLGRRLQVPVTTVPGGGHFLDREGWTTLPQAEQALAGMLGVPG